MVCNRWASSFASFYADMGPRPTGKHTIERINTDGDYEPGNCIWATQASQQRNRSNNVLTLALVSKIRLLHAFGIKPTEISKQLSVKITNIYAVLSNRNWNVKQLMPE